MSITQLKYLERRRQKVLEEPELNGRLGLLPDAEHHNSEEPFVQVPRSYAEDVDGIVFCGAILFSGTEGAVKTVAFIAMSIEQKKKADGTWK